MKRWTWMLGIVLVLASACGEKSKSNSDDEDDSKSEKSEKKKGKRKSSSSASEAGVAKTADPLAGFTKHASTVGGFEVMMPSKPEESATERTESGVSMTQHTTQVSSKDFAYAVSYIDVPEGSDAVAVRDGALNGMLNAVKLGNLKKVPVTLSSKYEGTEVTGTPPPPNTGFFRARSFLVNRRYFLVMALSEQEARSKAFIESFTITSAK